ncbi:MAG: hypothetical protein FWG99_11785 [Treponema sp.]|nr:hypothetical protein [Treponema sp.]
MFKKRINMILIVFIMCICAIFETTCAVEGSVSAPPPEFCGGIEQPHTWGIWFIETYATCTAREQQYRICSNCDVKNYKEVGNPIGHEYDNNWVNTPATCTETGGLKRTCIRYGCTQKESQGEQTPILGHVLDWIITTASTCYDYGTQTRSCIREGCEYITDETQDVLPMEHDFQNYFSNDDATGTADGTKTANCENGCWTTNTINDDGSKLIAPSAPLGVSAQATYSIYITINWIYTSDINYFIIYRSTGSSDHFEYLAETSSTSYRDNEVSTNTKYHYIVTAIDNNNLESNESNAVSATTSPDAPSGVTATVIGNSIIVTWNPVEGASMYVVYTFTAGTFYIHDPNITQFARVYSGAVVGDYFSVTAFNATTNLESARSIQVYARVD